MKNIILIVLAALLVFGCAGQQTPAAGNESEGGSILPMGGPEPSAEECTPDYSFSDLDKGTFSKTTKLVATVTCAGGKDLVVSVDGKPVIETTVESNGTSPVEFAIPGVKDGTVKLTIDSDGETIFSRDWGVEPLGNSDTFGAGYDSFSFKKYVAMAFDIGTSVDVGQIKLFMKRQSSDVRESSNIILEIRKDSSGEPGSLVTSKKEPISVTTLSENWIRFDFDEKVNLKPGTYWVVLRVEQPEDVALATDAVTVHYTVIDRDLEGNDYTRQMNLDFDLKSGEVTETSWEPLSYDREPSIVLSYGK